MYDSAFYKLSAREALKNNYWAALICAVVCVVPSYFSTKLGAAAASFGLIPDWSIRLLSAAVQIFVINILMVGFIRFLMKLAPREESGLSGYDYNLVFSGYKENFIGTLAATFMRQLKIFLWSLLAAAPTIIGLALIVVFVPQGALEALLRQWLTAAMQPTDNNIMLLADIIEKTIPHVSIYMLIWLAATALLIIPLIRKTYLYSMIPFIMAAYPDMSCKRAFKRSYDIMFGYRMRYFLVQLSFLGFIFMLYILYTFSGSLILYSLATAALMPYQYMTYYQFFKQRNETIEYNIEKYGETEKRESVL